MNKLFKMIFAFLGLAIIGVTEGLGDNAWTSTMEGKKTFKSMSSEEVEKLEDADYTAYKNAEKSHLEATIKALQESKATKEDLNKMQNEITELYKKQAEQAEARVLKVSERFTEEIEKITSNNDAGMYSFSLKEHKDEISKLKESGNSFKTTLKMPLGVAMKASQSYVDLTQNGELSQVQPGISDIVKKRPIMWDLFRKVPMVTDTYTYLEQTSVVRNAQGVAKCATGFTSLTKEEIGVQKVNDVKIKDTIDVCRDYADDFSFVEDRARMLVQDSVAFKIDTELLLGTNVATSTQSVNNVSSEFSALNPDASIGATIQDAQMVDLILGMATQIDVLGALASFKANVALVNKMDWFKNVESLKDTQGNYLDTRVRMVNGFVFLNDILIIPHTEVVANTMYVFDSSRGEILDRRMINLSISDENGTNFVDEFTTMMVTARLQFKVENNDANAFMKCSNITAAITAITKI